MTGTNMNTTSKVIRQFRPVDRSRPWHLAQFNVARPTGPLDAPAMAGFLAALAPVNALAEVSPGFVWRLSTDGDLSAEQPEPQDHRDQGGEVIVNLSVWESVLALADFVYSSEHLAVMRGSQEWFVPLDRAVTVLWWVPAGHRPSVEEAAERLACLRRLGPSARAFTFSTARPSPGELATPA